MEATEQAPPAEQDRPPRGPAAIMPTVGRYGKSFGIGGAFAVGWTPCVGPILGAILALAAASGTVLQGTLLLVSWSIGLGIPFLIAGLALGSVMKGIRKIGPLMPVLEIAGGLLVIFIGSLIFLDEFTMFNSFFTGGVDNVTSAEESVSGLDVEGIFGFAAAFVAGVIAFLSPCMLPMVPAYLMHLAGVSADSEVGEQRGVTFRHSLAFVGGFSLLFVILGASAGAVGFVIQDNMETIQKGAGVLLIAMGLNLIGILRIPFLYRTYQFEFPSDRVGGG